MMMSSKIQIFADRKGDFCCWNTLPKVLVSQVYLLTFQLHTEKNAFFKTTCTFCGETAMDVSYSTNK